MRRRCAQLCSGLRCHELSPLTFRPRYRPLPLLLQPSCRRATLFNYTGDQRAGTQVATAPADAFNAHRMRSSASSRAFSRSLVNDAPTNSTDTLPLSLCVYVYTARSSPRAFRRLRSFVYRVSVWEMDWFL